MIISLTQPRAVLRIGHALLTLCRMGGGGPVHLHPDDTRLVSGTHERGASSGTDSDGRTGEVADDQDSPAPVQSVHILLPLVQAETSPLSVPGRARRVR